MEYTDDYFTNSERYMLHNVLYELEFITAVVYGRGISYEGTTATEADLLSHITTTGCDVMTLSSRGNDPLGISKETLLDEKAG